MAMMLLLATGIPAQTIADSTKSEGNIPEKISIELTANDTLSIDSVQRETAALASDSSRVSKKRSATGVTERIARFKPEPYKATWLAVVLPGAGQIYNRKYWKLPIVYGGIMGCLYAYNWNNQMYSDYRQAFLDIMDADPNTKSYEGFFPSGYDFQNNEEYMKNLFKKRKDRYRRWRDLSVFACVGVYLISIVDAYVDAHLSSFDISDEINLSIQPDIMPDINSGAGHYGLNCNITF
jgi:hypothetical protein